MKTATKSEIRDIYNLPSDTKIDVFWKPHPRQEVALRSTADEVFFGGAAGGGKALPVDEDVITPFGVRKMGDLKRGDVVCHSSGVATKVVYATEPEMRDTYRLVFSDGAECEASDDHLWLYRIASNHKPKRDIDWRVETTEALIEWVNRGKTVVIPTARPAVFTKSYKYDMRVINPYILGLLIGDGSLRNGSIRFSTADDELVQVMMKEFADDFVADGGYNYRVRGESAKLLKVELTRLNLRVNAQHKHVPKPYLLDSVESRTELLRGLMDTDGYVDDRGHCSFSSASEQLAKDVQWLVRSLGGVASSSVKNTPGLPAHVVYLRMPSDIVPFHLSRKAARAKDRVDPLRAVVSIEPVGKRLVRCISVDHPEGTFLTRDFIVTHNSDYLLMDFLNGIEHGEAHRGVIFRRTVPELSELIIRSIQLYRRVRWGGAVYNKGTRTWTFDTGAMLTFSSLESELDVHKYQGHQFTWVGWDELTNWATDYAYVWLISRLRSAEGIRVRFRSAGNPGGVGHAWVKERFIDGRIPGQVYTDPVSGMTRQFIPSKLQDNLTLMENDPDYVNRMKALKPHLVRAYLEGDWDIFAGQAFEEWRREKHVIPAVKLEPHWKRFASMDWGFNKPFSIGWWCVDGDGRYIRFMEWYGGSDLERNVGIRMASSIVASKAFEMSAPFGVTDMVADPAIWNKIDDSPSVAERFADAGWNMEKGVNDRIGGLNRLHELMQTTGSDGRPQFLVTEQCPDFIRTIAQIPIDKKRPEDVDTNAEDHIYDESRYAVMSPIGKVSSPPRAHRITKKQKVYRYRPL